MKKALEIFKTGKHTAVSGQVMAFGEADLRATVSAYNPELHEAPLVVGHPGIDAPAYGWVKSLEFAGEVITAEPHQVDAGFAEMVNAGRFKKISGSFYLPDAPNNPVPGVFCLRHVGFLGAAPPAVKGLKSASFADAEEGVVEFGDWADQVEAGLFRRLREWIIGKFGMEEADKALPGWDVDTVQLEAASPEISDSPPAEPSFVENQTRAGSEPAQQFQEENMTAAEEIAAREAAVQQKEASFAEREAALKQKEAIIVDQGNRAFTAALVQAGKLLPALQENAVAMLNFASGLPEAQTIAFSEGDVQKTGPLASCLKHFLEAQPKIVEFGEVAASDQDVLTGAAAEKLGALVAKKLAADTSLSYSEALNAVQLENPDLAREYIADM